MFTIKIPTETYSPTGKYIFETLTVERLSADDARRIVERLTGDQYEPIYVHKGEGEDYEHYLTIMGGLDGKFVCEWTTIGGVSEQLVQPGIDQLSGNEEQVSDDDCGWCPVEEIVSKEVAADVLFQYVKGGCKPLAFNWRVG